MAESAGSAPVTIEFNGRTIAGSYKISRELITVTSSFGSKRCYVGAFHKYPEGLARIMLRELASEKEKAHLRSQNASGPVVETPDR